MMQITSPSVPLLRVTNITISTQSYNIPSPNEMEVDAPEYVDVSSIADRDSVAIINPDNADQDADALQDLPLATDCTYRSEPVLSCCHACSYPLPPRRIANPSSLLFVQMRP